MAFTSPFGSKKQHQNRQVMILSARTVCKNCRGAFNRITFKKIRS
ncbi:hypothetical protein X474_09475 [Dethiosulfatarculus sandiegensis]|uniref:Uncharacterized protein n=1 Tax=Dethiosulfatarculus sandiegensis TaxID=1429043 RepID=A0A0D2JXV2_9BACT|nr:hypothetical protein X474_09475 [Dethiosulfatarculus sandiegensis]